MLLFVGRLVVGFAVLLMKVTPVRKVKDINDTDKSI